MSRQVLGVSEVTLLIQGLIKSEPTLQECSVRGEVSNLKAASSGHLYFSLKDANAVLSCAMWQSRVRELGFRPADGMEVIAHGRVDVYPPRGTYQLVVEALEQAGRGDLWARLEELKRKLEAEGLFAQSRKRKLPAFPKVVVVISAATGAATQDMLTILARRYPPARVILVPAIVQGDGAADSLVAALAQAARVPAADVILIGRGGGSIEDLWAFNDERVVRAIASSPIPTIAAVGHETDVTLADFAADVRAPTPSAAAEMAVPDASDLSRRLRALGARLATGLRGRAERAALALRVVCARAPLARPDSLLDARRQALDEAAESLTAAFTNLCRGQIARLGTLEGRLNALSPRATMARGYAVPLRRRDGRIVRSIGDVAVAESLEVVVMDGRIVSEVLSKETHDAW